jgi:uncharacterized protein GlcG (DUF336 family)
MTTKRKFSASLMAFGSALVISTASFAGESVASPSKAGSLNLRKLFTECQKAAAAEKSLTGRANGTIMWCAIVDREGVLKEIKATDTGERPGGTLQTDAWRASIEIAIAKAFTAVSVSSDEQALTSAAVGQASQPGQPLWGIGNTNLFRPLTGNDDLKPDDLIGKKHHGIVTFGGGVPAYDCTTHKMVGAVGVSGDGVPADIAVATDTVKNAGYSDVPC